MTPVEAPEHNGRWDAYDTAGEIESLPYLDHYVTWWGVYHHGFAAANFIWGVNAINVSITVEGLRDALWLWLAGELIAATSGAWEKYRNSRWLFCELWSFEHITAGEKSKRWVIWSSRKNVWEKWKWQMLCSSRKREDEKSHWQSSLAAPQLTFQQLTRRTWGTVLFIRVVTTVIVRITQPSLEHTLAVVALELIGLTSIRALDDDYKNYRNEKCSQLRICCWN